jgi:DNA-binding LytR/AlgR family response regulator
VAAKYRVLVVEDEISIAENLMEILELSGDYKTDTAASADKALEKMESFKPNLVLLDINIQGEKDGIQVGEIIKEKYQLPFIYLTAYAEKAILERAKRTLPFGYLVKPFKVDGVLAAVEIAITNFENLQKTSDSTKDGKKQDDDMVVGDGIFARVDGLVRKIKFADIYHIEAQGRKILVHTIQQTLTVNKSIKEIEEKLPIRDFQRVHKSHIIRLDRIEAIRSKEVVVNAVHLPIGRVYLHDLKKRLIELRA